MPTDRCIAPAPDLVRHLAVLRRAMIVTRDYGARQDRAGMDFAGGLADALHNVPAMLLRYDEGAGRRPREIEEWLFVGFPRHVRGSGAPDHVIAACARVFSAEEGAADLGLSADLSDLDVAPPDELDHYLERIGDMCLSLRVLFRQPREPPARASVSPEIWAENLEEMRLWGTLLADAFSAVPSALVRWSRFDEAQFLQETLEKGKALPEKHRDSWRASFAKAPRP